MSTHWFHDHMFSFTSQNVYKGMAGMFNIYSALTVAMSDERWRKPASAQRDAKSGVTRNTTST